MIILAAGYGTRLGPLGEDTPKALLPLADRPALDWLLDCLRPVASSLIVVCNHRDWGRFEAWRPQDVRLVDDGSVSLADARGAAGSLLSALQQLGADVPTLVTAGDTLYPSPLEAFVERFAQRLEPLVAVWSNPDPEDRRRRGNPTLGPEGRLLDVVEKPEASASELSTAPLYALPGSLRHELERYLSEGGDRDSLGGFIGWLARSTPTWTARLDAQPWDIGHPAGLARARRDVARDVRSARKRA